jgi:hypothetical protein
MEECYPVDAFPLPSDIVGLGDSVGFTTPVVESTQIRGQILLRIHMRIVTEMRPCAASHTIGLRFGIGLLSCLENRVAPPGVQIAAQLNIDPHQSRLMAGGRCCPPVAPTATSAAS